MDSKLLDLTGRKFSLLIAIKRAEIVGYPEFDGWECKCLGCGRTCNVPTDELTNGKFHSCGCRHDGWKLAGKPKGRLLILRKDGHTNDNHNIVWLCRCECGRLTRVSATNLIKPRGTRSCGCLTVDAVKKANTKWNKTEKKLIHVFRHMKYRCYSKSCKFYEGYGGRGITICDEWLKRPEEFIDWSLKHGFELGKGLSIDRVDNNKGYSPENCRWVSMYAQSCNRRTSHYLTIKGYTHTITEWCRLAGLPDTTVFSRKTESKMKKRILRGFAENNIPFDVAKQEYFEKPILVK